MNYMLRTIITRVITAIIIGLFFMAMRQAHAQSCTTPGYYYDDNDATHFTTPISACQDAAARVGRSNAGYVAQSGGGDIVGYCTATGSTYVTGIHFVQTGNPVCTATCTGDITEHTFHGTGDFPAASICMGTCTYQSGGVGVSIGSPAISWTGTFTKTGANCTGGDTAGVTSAASGATLSNGNTTVSPATEKNCITANGEKFCIGPPDQPNCGTVNGQYYCGVSKKNCGFVNGKPECLGTAVQPGGCVTTANGQAYCVNNSDKPLAAPPAPNNGTQGTPAAPDVKVISSSTGTITTTSNNTTLNIFGGSTVAGSTQNPGAGSSQNDQSGTGKDCNSNPTSCAPTFTQGDPRDGEDPNAAIGNYWSAIQGAPIITAFTGIASSMPTGGSCPTATFTIAYINKTLTLDEHCVIADQIRSTLHVVMLAVWFLIAGFILLSA